MKNTVIIKPKSKVFSFNLKEIIAYKDLLWLLFRRDVVSVYKQTLLGPLWFFLQPILTSFAFTIIFSNIAKIRVDGLPEFLFYLCGLIPWTFFSSCVTNTSNLFLQNQHVFGKVYFPRLLVPMSLVLSNMLKFTLQFILFLIVWLVYYFNNKISGNAYALIIPVHIFFLSFLSMGIGMILSSLTIKYRDLTFLIGFALQLAMYLTPIIYPLSIAGKYKTLLLINPITAIIENIKYGFLGAGFHEFGWLILSYFISFVIFLLGIIVFNRAEKTFIDSI